MATTTIPQLDTHRDTATTYRAAVVHDFAESLSIEQVPMRALETGQIRVKVEASGLPTLALGDSGGLRQGQIVLAFGAPLGLDNSASMGVVSAPSRQLEPDSPMIYVQTDAPICNPSTAAGRT